MEECGCCGTWCCAYHAQQAAYAAGAREAALEPAKHAVAREAALREAKGLAEAREQDARAIARGESSDPLVREHRRFEHVTAVFGCPLCPPTGGPKEKT